MDDHTPIAFFILAAFDDQLTVVGNRSRGGALFGKQVGKKDNIVILYGDIFAIDQDKLYRIKIYVE